MKLRVEQFCESIGFIERPSTFAVITLPITKLECNAALNSLALHSQTLQTFANITLDRFPRGK